VAHGFLTLSLLSRFLSDTVHIHGVRMGAHWFKPVGKTYLRKHAIAKCVAMTPDAIVHPR
jgi:hypothetical protein